MSVEELDMTPHAHANQPDFDSNVMEALEALDDEAYVVNEVADDYFQHLDEDSTSEDASDIDDDFIY